jgi:hypothetical protein
VAHPTAAGNIATAAIPDGAVDGVLININNFASPRYTPRRRHNSSRYNCRPINHLSKFMTLHRNIGTPDEFDGLTY